MTHTKESLIAFRDKVSQAFVDKCIRCPIHLNSDEQAEPLLRIFSEFRQGIDWLFSGWRSMWHCLLAGMPEDELFKAVRSGRSMFIQSKERRIFCSSIVGGILPIAAGVAMGIKRNSVDGRVYVCVGDMTATTGLFYEFERFWRLNELPVRVIIEANGLSTDTPTQEAWGATNSIAITQPSTYHYRRTVPHVGVGQYVEF